MEIIRINTYQDHRFSQKVLNQHGCFLVDSRPYEIEIISNFEAIVRGENAVVYPKLIDEFRFYTPHITKYYDQNHRIVQELPQVPLLKLKLDQIQPSQFYVDREKVAAIRSFIHKEDDIIIQVLPYKGRYISLDGHTRLYYAVMNGWTNVLAVVEPSDDWIYGFMEEAIKRNIRQPKDLILVDHQEYQEKWIHFCDVFFAKMK